MSRTAAALAVVVLLLGAAPALGLAATSWTPVGPFGADVRALAADPGTPGRIYAATRYFGVYVSEDQGQTWTPRNSGLPKDPVAGYLPLYAVTVDPVGGKVYALGTGGISVWQDGGTSWTQMAPPAGATGWYFGLYTDPDDAGTLTVANVAGVFVYGYQGTDTERSWKQATGIASLPLAELRRTPSDPNGFYAVGGNTPTLYRSTDRAASFAVVGPLPGTGFRDLLVSPLNPDWIWVAVSSGVYASTDGGANWSPVAPAESQIFLLLVDPDPTLLAAGRGVCALGRGGIFADDLSSAALAYRREFYFTRGSGSVVFDDGSALVSTDMGVFSIGSVSQPAEAAVEYRTAGMDDADVTVVVPAKGANVVYAGTGVSFDAGVFRSDDGGNTWVSRSAGLTNLDVRSLAVFAGNPDIVYAGTADALDDTGENGGIFKSTDGGKTWTDLSAGLNHNDPHIIIAIVIHPTNPDIVYASVQGLFGGIYKTTDGGVTWARKANGLESMPIYPGFEEFHNYFAMLSLAMSPTDDQTLFIGAGGCWGGTYYTHDGGETWVRRSQAPSLLDPAPMEMDSKIFLPEEFPVHLELFGIAVDPNNSNHIYTSGIRAIDGEGQYGLLYQSVDGGLDYTIIQPTSGPRASDYFTDPITGMALHAARPGEIFLSTVGGVMTTADGGATWTAMNDGLATTKRFARGIATDPDDANRLYLATGMGGVYVRDLPATAVTLLSFAGDVLPEGSVRLRWEVTDEQNHLGYYVDREVDGAKTRLTTSLLRAQEFVDPDPVAGLVNRYWLTELDRDGSETVLGSVDVRAGAPIQGPGLSAVYPNPFTGAASVRLTASRAGYATVRVFDVTGRPVATLLDGPVAAGVQDLVWNGKDARGERARSGVYWIRGNLDGRVFQRQVVLAPGS